MKTTESTFTTLASLLLVAGAPLPVQGGGRDHCLRHRQLKQQATTSSTSSSESLPSQQQKNKRRQHSLSAGDRSANKRKSDANIAISLSPGVRTIKFQHPIGDIMLLGTKNRKKSPPPPPEAAAAGAGSVIILDHPIYHNEDRNTVIGKMAGSCLRVDEQWHCNGTYEFDDHHADGQSSAAGKYHSLTVAGPMALFHDDTQTDLWNSVLNGTGDYVGAMGEGHYVPQTDDEEWINVSWYFL